MDAHVQRREPAATNGWTVLLVALLLAATAYGAARAASFISAIEDPDPLGGEHVPTLRLGDARVEVLAAEQVVGIANADLMGGMGHGVSGLVGADQMMVQVWLRVSTGDRAADYQSSQLRAYTTGSRTPILPVSGSLGEGTLTPHSLVEGSVSFVVPRSWDHLSLGTTTSGYTIEIPAVTGPRTPVPTDDVGGHDHDGSARGGRP